MLCGSDSEESPLSLPCDLPPALLAPCGEKGAGMDLGTANAEAAEAEAELQLLSPRQEQMFPIKHRLLRCGCLADNKQQQGPVLLDHNEGWDGFSCVY